MITTRQTVGSVLVTLSAMLCSVPAAAQADRPVLHLSVGSFHHISDLHPYYATRFDDALVAGVGVTLPVHQAVVARIVLERASTHLSGGPAYNDDPRGADSMLGAEVQFVGAIRVTDGVKPYLGAGVGVRRYVVNSLILSDDVVHSPWAEPQIQPAIAALAGVGISITRRLGVAAEVKWSHARFRVADDSWGLPRDPVAWQQDLRPSLRLDLSPW